MPDQTSYDTGVPCWVDLATTDTEAAVRFYCDIFGWEDQAVPTGTGPVYHFFRKNGKAVAGCGPIPPEQAQAGMPPHWSTYLSAGTGEVTAKATQAGGQVVMPPMDVMDQGRMAILADPTGAATGVWEARAHAGAEVVNEPGAMSWNELNTPDIAASTAWLEQVFGVTTEDVPGTPNPYKTFSVGGQVRGGIQQMGSDAERFPSHWMTYFGVEDADAMVRKVAAAGGRVNQEPFDTGFGRMAVVSDPQGAVFMINEWLSE